MKRLHNPRYDTKYAAVTFGSTATVNFRFFSYPSVASEKVKLSYPGGWANSEAGLAAANKLFDDPYSGIFFWKYRLS